MAAISSFLASTADTAPSRRSVLAPSKSPVASRRRPVATWMKARSPDRGSSWPHEERLGEREGILDLPTR